MIVTFLVWIPITLLIVVVRLAIKVASLTAKLAIFSAKKTAVNTVKMGYKGVKKIDRDEELVEVDKGTKFVNRVSSVTKGAVSGGARASKNTIKDATRLGVNTVKKTYKTGKRAVRTTYRTGKSTLKVAKVGTRVAFKTGKVVVKAVPKVATSTVKLSVSLLRFVIMAIHFLIVAISTLTSVVISMGAVVAVCVLLLTVVVVAGGVFMSFWDDDIGVHTKRAEIVVNQSTNKSGSGDDKLTIGNAKLEDLDTAVLNYEVNASKSSHKKNCSTSLSRKDLTKFANLLMGKGNTISRGGATVCKYLCYNQDRAWGRYPDPLVIDMESFSKSGKVVNAGNFKSKAGIPFSKNKIFTMDCSTFIGWFYATFFVAYDKDNKDLDELANWYIGLSSGDYDRADLNEKIDRKDLKPGDVIHVTSPHGHVCLYIGNGKVIGASQSSTGIKLGNLSYYENNSTVSYHRPYFKFRGE